MNAEAQNIKALLFDLGGIVINIDVRASIAGFAELAGMAIETLQHDFHADALYHDYECGKLTTAQYFRYLQSRLGIMVSDQQMTEAWNAMLGDLNQDTFEAINQVRTQLPCYAFSNTNTAHKEKLFVSYPDVMDLFNSIYFSCDLGARKPDRIAYQLVAKRLGVEPGKILFFDDSPVNVSGALDAGFQAVHVRSPENLCEILKSVAA